MKNIFLSTSALLLSVSLTVISCKKDSTPTGGGVSTTSNNYTLSAQGDINGTYNGFLFEIYEAVPGYTLSTAQAGFFNTPIPIQISSNTPHPSTGSVSSVYFNNIKLPYDPSSLSYSDSTQTLTFPPAVWLINGNAAFPSFTYTCTTALPAYTNTASLPASVNRSQNLVIPISGASGYDQIEVDIDDASSNSQSIFLPATVTSVTFVKDSLAKLSATSNGGSINILLIKYNPQTIGGKNYLFAAAKAYSKSGVVIQ